MTHVSSTVPTHVRTHGTVPPAATEYAVEKLDAALHHAPAPVVGSWLTLDSAAPGDRVDAQVHVGGVHLHVHAVGETLQEATDLMQQRLRSRLRRIRRRPDQGPPPPRLPGDLYTGGPGAVIREEEDMNSSGTTTAAEQPLNSVEEVILEPRVIVGLRQRVALSELGGFFARAVPAVAGELARVGTHPDGPPVAVYRHEEAQHFDVTVGFPVAAAPTATDALVREVLPGGPAAIATHVGSYETLSGTYADLGRWFARRHLGPPEVMWEEYLVGPGTGPEDEYRTRVVYPLS